MNRRANAACLLLALVALAAASSSQASAPAPVLVGTDAGLYSLPTAGEPAPLWTGGAVRKILRAPDGWYFMGSAGILYSPDLVAFEERNAGLPVKTIKYIGPDGKKAFRREVQELKDLEIDPEDPAVLVAGAKQAVFYSLDAGRSWKTLAFPQMGNIKAVAIRSRAAKPVIYASHPIRGVYRYRYADKKPAWVAISAGLEKVWDQDTTEEVSDLAFGNEGGKPVLYAANSFRPRIYKFDEAKEGFATVWKGTEEFGFLDSLAPGSDGIRAIGLDGAYLLGADGLLVRDGKESGLIAALAGRAPGKIQCVAEEGGPSYCELWAMDPPARKAEAKGRKGIYLPTGYARDEKALASYLKLMKADGLDTLVIDMKDDQGYLRFAPKGELQRALGKTRGVVDVEALVARAEEAGVYLVARVVVFKDPILYAAKGNAYAVWDSKLKKPWKGLEKEFWVDPYCETVWQYEVGIGEELVARGFDEVQFDYIRFPTDGPNLADASYRFKDPGMDKESALMSFLGYARERIRAPISIDIYGANGWYRTGAATGQDVELLARYVDAICPMYYPSHFEQDFLAFKPAEKRPYRIYYHGSMRTHVIARGKVVVRPYVQAFYLAVSYDKKYYGPDYIRMQTEAIRDGSNGGFTYWNASGSYKTLPLAAAVDTSGIDDTLLPVKRP